MSICNKKQLFLLMYINITTNMMFQKCNKPGGPPYPGSGCIGGGAPYAGSGCNGGGAP